MRQLTGFSIRAEDETFVLSLTDDSGRVEEFGAAPEQVDAVIDALDELLADYVEDDFIAPGGPAAPRAD